jgi:adenylate cyclase
MYCRLLFVLFGGVIMLSSLQAAANPDSLINQSFPVQFNGLQKITVKLIQADSANAVTEIDAIVKWAESKGDYRLTCLAKIFRWRVYRHKQRKVDGFEKEGEEIIETATKKKMPGLKAVMQRELAQQYRDSKESEAKALEYFISAYEILRNYTAFEYLEKADFLYDLGGRYYHFRDYATAKKYFLECWQTVPVSLIDNKISKMNTLALSYSYLEENDSAAYYFKTALKWAEENNDQFWIGYVSGNLAGVYYNLGQYKEAIPLFLTDVEYSMKFKEWGGAARSLAQLSDNYLRMGDKVNAYAYAKKAYTLICEKNQGADDGTVKGAYPYLSRVYAANGQYALAWQFMDSAARSTENFMKSRSQLLLAGARQKVEVEKHLGEIKIKESELNRQKLFRNMYLGGLAVLLFFSVILFRQKRRIHKEKNISDDLLRNILPAETAEELKRTGTAKAKNYNSVTVLFTDFKNFSEVSSKMSAQQVVEEINYCYSEFDKIITKYNLEKIKTIGDSYMCAGGLPMESKTHATDVIYAAMDMVAFMEKEKQQRISDNRVFLEMRIGINTGPVVAGIVGIKKFTYDIWGDTVNIASRMESSGIEGRINISETTYQTIKDRFRCSFRGEVEVKNKGILKMYFVEEEILNAAEKKTVRETSLS